MICHYLFFNHGFKFQDYVCTGCHDLTIWKMYKHAVKHAYVLDQYQTQQMCDKTIIKNRRILKSVPDCYKNLEMCNKAVDNYSRALEFVPKWRLKTFMIELPILILLQ